MTEQDFLTIINDAISSTKRQNDGGYTCHSIMGKWLPSGRWTNESILKRYKFYFNLSENQGITDKKPFIGASDRRVKRTRLAMLELFKEICLTTKEYENF